MSYKGKKYITMNTADNSVHIVIAPSYHKAFKQAKAWFGNKPIRVWRDTLSTSLS